MLFISLLCLVESIYLCWTPSRLFRSQEICGIWIEFVLHQFSLRCVVRDAHSTLCWIWLLACSSPAFPNIEKQSEKTWTSASCIFDNSLSTEPIVSQTCFVSQDLRRALDLQEVSLRIHDEERYCKQVYLVLCTCKILIAQLLQGNAITQNATWLQHLLRVLITHSGQHVRLCHHLRHCLGLC